jgi:hypothetical protein
VGRVRSTHGNAYTMMPLREIAWLAGLLEGEGCFFAGDNGGITVQMKTNDKDVIMHAAGVLGAKRVGFVPRNGYDPAWIVRLSGALAIGWMMTVYPFMGERRRSKIREYIVYWKSRPGKGRFPKSAETHAKIAIKARSRYQLRKYPHGSDGRFLSLPAPR